MSADSHAFDTEAQAAGWLVRLEADGSAATRVQWRQWVSGDPRRHATYLRLELRWRQAECLRRLRPLDGAVDPDLLATFPTSHRWRFVGFPPLRFGRPGLQPVTQPSAPASRDRTTYRALAATLAAATAILACGLILRPNGAVRPDNTVYRTERGGLERIALSDGSTVMLNTNSEIRLRFTREHREILLTRGEALFTVAHESRPFEVEAAGNTVRAVATSFAVRVGTASQATDGQLEVIVTRGKVAVDDWSRRSGDVPAGDVPSGDSSNARRSMLSSGEDALLDKEGALHIQRMDATSLEHKLAWTRGEIWLENNTVAEAVAEFNRYNTRQFVLADPALGTLRVGGSFATNNPDAFIAALERVFDIRMTEGTDDLGRPVTRLAWADQ